jgi:nitrite reductase/ring-hydroxylating ferredoxin subunit
LSRNPAQPLPGTVLCPLEEISDAGAKGFVFREADALFAGFILREGSEIRGFIDRCPHNGMPLSALPDRYLTRDGRFIICSGHGALFLKADGVCVAGPCAGESLETWAVTVSGGAVVVAG